MVNIQYVSVDELKHHPQNPRQIDQDQFDILCESLRENKEYFETRPILANKDMVVFAGNMRLRAAKHIGMKEVPVAIMDISEKKQKEIMIRDNRQNGQWDWNMLANTFDNDELIRFGFSKGELGLEANAIDDIDRDNLGDALDSYLDGSIRQIVLYFKKEDYEATLKRLENITLEHGIESHTKALLFLLDHYENTRTKK